VAVDRSRMNLKNIIVALDHDDPAKAVAFVEEVSDLVDWFKIGPTLYVNAGIEMIQFLQSRNKQVFLDLKLHDIPVVVESTLRLIGALGVSLATVHCLGGRKMLELASRACRGFPLQLLGVTLLTSFEESDARLLGWSTRGDTGPGHTELLKHMVTMALDARLAGVVCSPGDLKSVRSLIPRGFLLVTPGIRPRDSVVFQDDQIRVATPNEAVSWGADFLVVGRPITGAREPRVALNHLLTAS